MNKTRILFFHRVVEGFYETDFDHGILMLILIKFFFESLSFNNNKNYRFS